MKKILLFFCLLVTAATPIIAQTNPKNKTKTKTVVTSPKSTILVKDQPQTNVDIQWKESMMVKVPGGTFFRADKFNRYNPRITVSSFYMSRYEVTFDQYDAFCTATGRTKPVDNGMGRGKMPVINVSYIDAVDYCKWLSDSTKKAIRLPAEAEWEYAAVGITGIFTISEDGYYFGGAKKGGGFQYSGLFKHGYNPDSVAWYRGNTGKKMPAGTKAPNKYGLYDMTGNVREWCHDMYSPDPSKGIGDYYYYIVHPVNPTGPSGDIRSYAQRVIRGGGYRSDSLGCRLFIRQHTSYSSRTLDLGFRFVYDCTDCVD